MKYVNIDFSRWWEHDRDELMEIVCKESGVKLPSTLDSRQKTWGIIEKKLQSKYPLKEISDPITGINYDTSGVGRAFQNLGTVLKGRFKTGVESTKQLVKATAGLIASVFVPIKSDYWRAINRNYDAKIENILGSSEYKSAMEQINRTIGESDIVRALIFTYPEKVLAIKTVEKLASLPPHLTDSIKKVRDRSTRLKILKQLAVGGLAGTATKEFVDRYASNTPVISNEELKEDIRAAGVPAKDIVERLKKSGVTELSNEYNKINGVLTAQDFAHFDRMMTAISPNWKRSYSSPNKKKLLDAASATGKPPNEAAKNLQTLKNDIIKGFFAPNYEERIKSFLHAGKVYQINVTNVINDLTAYRDKVKSFIK